jgi:NADH:ubiquinone oxidoreductase subunit 2 (subunit N)
MYFPSDLSQAAFPVSTSLIAALAISAVGVLYFGLFPEAFIDWVQRAAAQLLAGL